MFNLKTLPELCQRCRVDDDHNGCAGRCGCGCVRSAQWCAAASK